MRGGNTGCRGSRGCWGVQGVQREQGVQAVHAATSLRSQNIFCLSMSLQKSSTVSSGASREISIPIGFFEGSSILLLRFAIVRKCFSRAGLKACSTLVTGAEATVSRVCTRSRTGGGWRLGLEVGVGGR